VVWMRYDEEAKGWPYRVQDMNGVGFPEVMSENSLRKIKGNSYVVHSRGGY